MQHAAEVANLTWQGFILLNLGGLLALAFWSGRLAQRVKDLETRVSELEHQDTQAVPVARIDAKLDALSTRVGEIQEELRTLRSSVLVRAMQAGSQS